MTEGAARLTSAQLAMLWEGIGLAQAGLGRAARSRGLNI